MKIIFNNRLVDLLQSGLVEQRFLVETITEFKKNLGEISNFKYHLINGYEDEMIDLRIIDEHSVVFIFDEKQTKYPAIVSNAGLVLQAFIGEHGCLARNHICFPLGFNNSFRQVKYIPVNSRKISVFFSGNLHSGRHDFHSWLSGIRLPFFIQHRLQRVFNTRFDRRFPAAYIRFTRRFNAGLPGGVYSAKIADSKIVLCPGGILSVESFRLYEAMMQGCVIVSEKLPKRRLFLGCPILEVTDWREASKIINGLLENPDQLDRLSKATQNWYNNNLSPKALGKMMFSHLQICSNPG